MSDLSQEQLQNAAIIYQTGQRLGASRRDILIALAVAYTESRLVNVNYGDRDSLGLFQQRAAWGPRDVRMDPAKSARMFFTGGQQGQRGLFDFTDRKNMGMGEVARAVQVSAFPDRYGENLPTVRGAWQDVLAAAGIDPRDMDGDPYGTKGKAKQKEARLDVGAASLGAREGNLGILGAPDFDLLGAKGSSLLGAPQMNTGGQELLGPKTFLGEETNKIIKDRAGEKRYGKGVNATRKAIMDIGRDLVGTPYTWGGASPGVGFDCSGLVQYVYGQLGVQLPRVSYQQANAGEAIPLKRLRPGDLVAWDNSSRNPGADHIAIYLGNGQILEAPQPGQSVRIRDLGDDENAWGVRLEL